MYALIHFISSAICVSVAFGWGMPADGNNPVRKSMCLQAGESCFATKECCEHYVCAAFDEIFGTDPKKPGLCVKEKDLRPCGSHTDCDYQSTCRKLAHNHQMYCVTDPSDLNIDEIKNLPPAPAAMRQKSKGGLGKSCGTSDDCQRKSKDGSRLCCQKVNRYRSGFRTLCDKVTLMSDCL